VVLRRFVTATPASATAPPSSDATHGTSPSHVHATAGIVARPVADVPVRRRVFAAVRAGAERRPAVAALLDALAARPSA
jgi:hypothetical protein